MPEIDRPGIEHGQTQTRCWRIPAVRAAITDDGSAEVRESDQGDRGERISPVDH